MTANADRDPRASPHHPGGRRRRCGRCPEVLAKLGLSRPLVVTDPYMVSSGLVRRCLDPLEAAGLHPAVFSETVPEPTDTVIDAGAALLAAGSYDCLIGFGGGSPIDTAKAMAILDVGRASGAGRHMRDFKVPVTGRRRGAAGDRRADHGGHRQRGHALHRHHRHRARREDADRRHGGAAAGGGGGLRADLHRSPPHHRRHRRGQPDPCAGGLRVAPGQPVFRRRRRWRRCG